MTRTITYLEAVDPADLAANIELLDYDQLDEDCQQRLAELAETNQRLCADGGVAASADSLVVKHTDYYLFAGDCD
ncbi:hypothetical protein [Haloarchaeobius sp. DFWS5]|uniref:hypothetical protein n=1 Tax=Haloarchaeobius sp. DFWS5 TaxID=3446114 RepID=UPI003EBF5AD1